MQSAEKKSPKPVLVSLLLCLIFFSLALFSTAGFRWNDLRHSGDSITSDEFAHISAGYYYLKTNRYFFNPEHPPLIKDISAIPLLFMKPTLPPFSKYETSYEYPYPENAAFSRKAELRNDEWSWGYLFLFFPGNDIDKIVFWSRLAVIFFNSILLWLLYYSLRKIWNSRAALIALFFIVSSQFTLAHGALVTMDFASSILQILTLAWLYIFLEKYTKDKKHILSFLLLSLFLALALLAKFSSIVLVPAIIVISIFYLAFTKKSLKSIFLIIPVLFLMFLFPLVCVSVYYSAHLLQAKSGEIAQQLYNLYPENFSLLGYQLLLRLVRENIFFQGLAEFLLGIVLVARRIKEADQIVYFLGRLYGPEGGGFWYFPVLYLTKLPLTFLFFLFFTPLIAIIEFFKAATFKKVLNNFIINIAKSFFF